MHCCILPCRKRAALAAREQVPRPARAQRQSCGWWTRALCPTTATQASCRHHPLECSAPLGVHLRPRLCVMTCVQKRAWRRRCDSCAFAAFFRNKRERAGGSSKKKFFSGRAPRGQKNQILLIAGRCSLGPWARLESEPGPGGLCAPVQRRSGSAIVAGGLHALVQRLSGSSLGPWTWLESKLGPVGLHALARALGSVLAVWRTRDGLWFHLESELGLGLGPGCWDRRQRCSRALGSVLAVGR